MPKKKNVSIDQIKTLFVESSHGLISKEDNYYVEAFSKIISGTNKNDVPFTKNDIIKQPTLNDFNFNGKNDFIYICQLIGQPISNITTDNWENERILAINFKDTEESDSFFNSMGVAYIITCVIGGKEHIVKFGQTRTPFSARLGSYNCGVINNLRTASTTNIKILQSFVACKVPFNLYLYDCGEPQIFKWRGEDSVPFASSFPLAVEDIMLKKFRRQFGIKPLANIQANATEND
jgi:hypothetical protein